MLWESCSSSYTKHNKVESAIFGFLCDFIRFYDISKLQVKHTKGKIHFAARPLELSELHKSTLAFSTQNPARMNLHHRSPSGAGELAAGEGSPELAHKRHWTAIELTTE
jgi:hypothetical protein